MTQMRKAPFLLLRFAVACAVREAQAAGIDRPGMPGQPFRELAP
jgi:hypothetical protein